MTKKAIIIGAGIAGPILAIQLKEIGYSVEIYEARSFDQPREGLFIGLSPNGLNVLSRFIDLERLKQDYTAGSMAFFNQADECIATFGTDYQKAKYGYETLQIKRFDLCQLVLEAAEQKGIPVFFDKKATNIIEKEQGVVVHFSDGLTVEADLLFGADGTFSAVRKAIFPDAIKPEYTRNISTGGYARLPELSKPMPEIKMTFGERGFFAYTVSNRGEIWWFNNYYRKTEPSRESLKSIMQEEIVSDLLTIHKNDPPIISEIIHASYDFIAYSVYDLAHLKLWHSKFICLVGDAAHAIAPHSGQGASLALEDTVVLANCLKAEENAELAFQKYQSLRAGRVNKIIKRTRKVGNQKSKPNGISRWFRDKMLGFFIRISIRQMDQVYGYKAGK